MSISEGHFRLYSRVTPALKAGLYRFTAHQDLAADGPDGALAAAALPVEDKNTPIVVYCASGGRSSMAQALLAQMGYSRVTNGGSPQEVAAVFNKPLVAG